MVKVLKMLRYIFISIFIVNLVPLMGQEKSSNWEPAQGFTLGVNLAGPVNSFFNDETSGISFVSRMSIKKQLLFMAEAGYEKTSFEKSNYHYNSDGTFLKVGIEYDAFKEKEVGRNDNLLFGLHYGFAFQEQSCPQYVIENGYWGNYTGSLGSSSVNTHWIEVSAGPRMELFKNFYMAWAFRVRIALLRDYPNELSPYQVPGFGNGDNMVNLGFSYTVEYMIPWKKAKVK